MISVMNNTNDFEIGGNRTNPRVESEAVVDVGSSEDGEHASVDDVKVGGSMVSEGNVNNGGAGDLTEGKELRVFDFDDKEDVGLTGKNDGFSNRNRGSVKLGKNEQQRLKGQQRREMGKMKSPVYDSMLSMFDEFAANGSLTTAGALKESSAPVHSFEVGDMVWGKVKSHPWWPGHVYSEEFATPSVRRSKRDGLLLVAFFGDSSYGWFDPSELIPFDSNFAEKSRQTTSRTFLKAVEEAIDEVSRRRGLGLSCMCRNKQNFRERNVQGYFAVDVPDYEPGAVYSIDVIAKARENFQPRATIDFVRQLALAPLIMDHGINFIKNKATVMSYRKAVYEEFDETYAQAFGHHPVRPPPGAVQELPSGKTPSKAPLSGRQVFADTAGKGKSSTKPNKAKDHSKKDKYLFKRRDEAKVQQREEGQAASSPQPAYVEDSSAVTAGVYVLQKRVPATYEQAVITATDGDSALEHVPGTDASMEETPTVLKCNSPDFQMNVAKVESPGRSAAGEIPSGYSGSFPEVRWSVDEQSRALPEMEDRKTSSNLVDSKPLGQAAVFSQGDSPSSLLHKVVSIQREDSGKKVKVRKRPVGELSTEKSVLPEKKKKRKKLLMPDGTQIRGKEGGSSVGKVSVKKPVQSALALKPPIENSQRTDVRALTSSPDTDGKQEVTGSGSYEVELPQVLGDLQALALDPFHAIERGQPLKIRQVFLSFRSLVFQKSLALSAPSEDEANEILSSKSSAVTSAVTSATNEAENAREPLVKPKARPSGRPDDPTKGGRKRGPSDRQEEIAAKKKKKVSDIRNLTSEKAIRKTPEAAARGEGKQAVISTPKKVGPEFVKKTEQRVPEPTMLTMKFPPGGSLPSINELKARFARFGPMDHSATRIFWNTFTCRVVYRHKSHAQAAYKFVVGASSLFGNMDVKCSLKEVGVVGSADPELPAKVAKEEAPGAPSVEHRPSVALPSSTGLKSCLKKSSGEEAGGNGGNGSRGMSRVKFMLGGEESNKNNNATSFADGAASSSSSSHHATMDFNSKNFQKAILQSPNPLPPLLPLPPTSTTSSTAQYIRPPQSSSMHYSTETPPPPPPASLPPPPPLPPRIVAHNFNRPIISPPSTSNIDIAQQFLSLLTKCNDVVANVTGLLGYVPYHPL